MRPDPSRANTPPPPPPGNKANELARPVQARPGRPRRSGAGRSSTGGRPAPASGPPAPGQGVRYGISACLEIMPPGPARPPPPGAVFPDRFCGLSGGKTPRAGSRGWRPTGGGAAPRCNAPKPDALWRWRISASAVREPLRLAGTGGCLSDPRPDRSALKRRRLSRSVGVFLPPLRPPRPTKRGPLSGRMWRACRTAAPPCAVPTRRFRARPLNGPAARRRTRGAGQPGRALQAGPARLCAASVSRAVS